MPAPTRPPILSNDVEPEESAEEEGPLFAYLPPDDRLWRHPSEMRGSATGSTSPVGAVATLDRPLVRTWTIALLAGMVGALVASGVSAALGGFDAPRTTVLAPVTRVITPNTLASASGPQFWLAANKVASSVASITESSPSGQRTGSGVVYAVDQRRVYLLTDAGLVPQGARLQVTFSDGNPMRGYLMQSDPKSGLALLYVLDTGVEPPLLGSVGSLHEAEQVMTVGARTDGAPPVVGSVSSMDRTVVDSTSSIALSGMVALGMTVPADDAGGAVVDQWGVIVGIATSTSSGNPSDAAVTFMVPMDAARHVASQMMVPTPVTHPWLGVLESTDLASANAAGLGLLGGAQLVALAPGSPLADAHLKANDVVVGLDGTPITSSGDLTARLAQCTPGSLATVSYRHAGRPETVTVRVAEQPTDVNQP